MVARRDLKLPTKLKRDAILESVLELRFATAVVSEVFLGKLIQHWPNYQQRRLAAYEIPP